MKKEFLKRVLINLIIALVVIIYFVIFSTQYTRLDSSILYRYTDISSLIFLVIAIIAMEISYKKSNEYIFLSGVELAVIAVFTLLTKHVPKVINCSIEVYTLAGANLFVIYTLLKNAILYTKQNQDELENMSDIKEIVKDEPVKKISKRKNGKSSLSINSREYQVEIKTVNHKYIDVNIKMPRIISYLEEDVRKLVVSKIKRGKVDIQISFENYSQDGNDVKINTELAQIYIQSLRKLAEAENLSSNIEVTEITKLPDVLTIKSNLDENETKEELLQVVNEAIDKLIQMRKIEGEKISKDILDKIARIEQKNEEIFSLSTGLIEEYVVKLEARVKELLKTEELDKSRLMQEVVIYADKCSVEEEVTRLRSHIYQLRYLINSEEPIGKKMDFLIQEMNRETNTIGSKANNLEITNTVVDIKTILEDIREQIQNIE